MSGGFTYDAALYLVSDIYITLTTSTPGSPYTLTNRFFPTLGGVFFGFTKTGAADYTGQATLWIEVASALTDKLAGRLRSNQPRGRLRWLGVLASVPLHDGQQPRGLVGKSGRSAGAGNVDIDWPRPRRPDGCSQAQE